MSTFAFPHTTYVRNGAVMEPTYTYSGMTLKQYYLGCILQGLASNPATMLNIDDHLVYAERLARSAANTPSS